MPYVERGAGPLVLFVHGSLCDHRYWQPQVAGLSAHYRCVAVSLTHYWPLADLPPPAPFSWSRHADELAVFLEKLDAGPAHVVAHSRGGAVAFQFALRHPQHLQTLTLADPGGPLSAPGQPHAVLPDTVNALRARAAQLIERGDPEAGVQLFVDSVSRVGSWAKSTPAFRAMALDNASTLPLQFQDPLPAYRREDAWSLRCPTLLIDGEKSPDLFRRNVNMLEGWVPDVRRQTIRGASHGMNLAHPRAFNAHIDEFIREQQ
ncbi:alpha/beta fold hydrolase [Trinickia soli]|uniref:alpha/beta fold hydrolase n=1 Tax=Trinickia soli TaxID=380675 RepID=UPI001253968F|nr:alpha/beta hydrolase [Paraburkholderia sp. T12-10]